MRSNNFKNKIYAIIFAIVMGNSLSIWGQVPPTLQLTEPLFLSPQTMEMIRYDYTPVEMTSGRVDISIPIVQVNDKDFDFPVSISYNSSGFRPTEPDNYVGRNWYLKYGGIVYRSIRGIPDDMENYLQRDEQSECEVNGFMKLVNKGVFNMNTMRSDIEKNPYKYAYHINNYISLPTIPGTNKIEASPDIFYFSFGKHAGKFMINYDGTISVVGYNGGKYEVDLSKYEMMTNSIPSETRISIKTDDGYIYTFGGDNLGSVEYTALIWDKENDPLSASAHSRPTISSWYLTQIKAPNGRILKIHYKDIPWEYHKDPYSMMQISRSQEFKDKQYALHYVQEGHSSFHPKENEDYYNAVMGRTPNHYGFSLLKIALPDLISTDCWNMQFHYSVREKYPKLEYLRNDSFRGARLDSVVTRYKENNLFNETTSLKYNYECGDRMFLTSLHHAKNGKYQFQYNQSAFAPSPMTTDIDHWKFWRGTGNSNKIFPSIQFDNLSLSMDYKLDSNEREPTGKYVDYTLLNSMIYPTGGKAEFHYEPHKYTQRIVRNARSRYIPTTESCNSQLAGGARINSILYFQADNSKPVKEIRYKYGEEEYEGILQYIPCYIYARYYAQDKQNYTFYGCMSNSDGITAFPYPAPHIIYPEVSEYYIDTQKKATEENSPYKKTRFNTDPDRYHSEFLYNAFTVSDNDPAYFMGPLGSRLANQNMFIAPSWELAFARGKTLNEWYYNKEKQLVRTINYFYRYHQQKDHSLCTYYVNPQPTMSCGLYTHVGKVYFGTYLQEEKWTQDYHSGFMQKDFFKWNEDGHLAEQTLLLSSGDSLTTSYRYSRTLPALITDKKKTVSKNGETKTIQFEHLDYRWQNNNATNTPWLVTSNYLIGTDSLHLEKRATYPKYDLYGNPVHVEKDSTSYIYIWGYSGQYLVAKIENTTYDEVTIALDGDTPEALSEITDYSTVAIQIEKLRSRLPKAYISSYTYEPGVGMSSSTDPSGKTIFYEYDEKGRLSQTYRMGDGGTKEILQLNDYHIINE